MGLLALGILFFLADTPNVGSIPALARHGSARLVVKGFVQTQMLRLVLGRLRAFDHYGIEGIGQKAYIRDIGSGNADRTRAAAAFDKQAFLDACLAAVGRVLADALVLRPFLAVRAL